MPRLPQGILVSRLRAELQDVRDHSRHFVSVSDETFSTFPVEVAITLMNTPGPIWSSGRVRNQYTHKLVLFITEEYPYEKPIVRWKSQIFHPNIMLDEDGGHVCTKLLDDWRFESTILSFLSGVETLLVSPNPESPYATDSCTEAAAHFAEHPYRPPGIISEKKKKKRLSILGDG